MQKVRLKKLHCKRCGYEWAPRTEIIVKCPSCGSPYWDRERRLRPEGDIKMEPLIGPGVELEDGTILPYSEAFKKTGGV